MGPRESLVGVDIGGTFTDLAGWINGKIVTAKASTVPADPAQGIADTLALARCDMERLAELLHGSTIAINTVLERKGARAALVTTKGFRDVYAIGRGNRIESFNLFFHRPKPLIARDLTFEISERMNAKGEVLTPLYEAEAERLVQEILTRGVEAVAVCLLHSYANPAHEQRIGQILRNAASSLFVTLSHEILREYREYERTSTVALNAYVGPRVHAYLQRLETRLHKDRFAGAIRIMRSNGGVMSVEQAREQPVAMMESGPVAGMIAAGKLARNLGLVSAIGFDMGGTTAKTSLIAGGAPAIEDGYTIGGEASGQKMQLPVVDIVEVGAGGGSIAWIDAEGGIHVGPQSAGADPGPACYGKGSLDPVVTDANLVLGRLNPDRFLNGAMALDVEASIDAIKQRIADPLRLSVADAALGILRIADAKMSLAVRAVSVNRGVDPRDTPIIAFGGGGPLHASAIAREIFVPTVIVPKFPGTFSALGMLMAPFRQDFVRTLIGRLGTLNPTTVEQMFTELRRAGEDRLARDGLEKAAADFSFFAHLRYTGQEHTLPIRTEGPEMLTSCLDALRARFHEEHNKRYSQSAPEESMEVVSLRLVVTAERSDNAAERWLSEPFLPGGRIEESVREVVFDDPTRAELARIFWRAGLPPGSAVAGPAVIEEANATTLIRPGDVAIVDPCGNLIITIGGGERA